MRFISKLKFFINNNKKNKNATVIYLIFVLTVFVISFLTQIFERNTISSSSEAVSKVNIETDFLKITECFIQENSEKCFDDFIKGYAKGNKDTKQMLHDMEFARGRSVEMENGCHPVSHAIGRYTYEVYNNIGDAFNACDQSCHSGCYHGVMERMFYSDEEISSKSHLTFEDIESKMPGICNEDKFSNPNSSVIFQCLHGVGHAVLFSLDYNLEDSLKACDLLSTTYEQSSCWGGVFMENITAFDKKKRDLKKGDYLYPCNKIEEKYKNSCYLMQTSVMLEYGLTVEQISDQCMSSELPNTCFVSMGRDLSNFVRTGNVEYVRSSCENLPSAYAANCIDGTIYALVDNTWDGQFSLKFCQSMKNPENKTVCYRDNLNYLAGVYQKSKREVESECEKFAGVDVEICKENIPF